MNRVLLYFSIKYHGNWDQIYDALDRKEKVDRNEVMQVEKELQCKYITILDSEYPNTLRELHRPPFVLFYEGNIKLLWAYYKTMGFICEKPNNFDLENIKNSCLEIKNNRLLPLTTFSPGASETALSIFNQLNTQAICLLDFDLLSSKSHEPLQKVVQNHGLIISELYASSSSLLASHNANSFIFKVFYNLIIHNGLPLSKNEQLSNRIISGLTNNTVFFQMPYGEEWGAIINYAICNGGNIFAVPEDHESAKQFIKRGVIVTDSIHEILDTI